MVQVLRRLPPNAHPDLLVGTDQLDDAGVFRLDDGCALVQTLDFFPPLVDDPYTFGRIAAANALSDVYAMGGQPLTAMNIVGFPDQELPVELLVEILRGGSERVTEAGAVVVGGHSVRDAEIKYGLSVTGRVHPQGIVTNAGAQPGDRLVLTKPIGSGVLTSAAKAGHIEQEDLAEAVEVMIHLNRSGCEAMIEVGAHAATDITGFGLLGHAFEIAQPAGVTLAIDAAAVPLLERALEWARKGVVTRAHKATLAHLGDELSTGEVDGALVNALADAQTSGGLLICVTAERTDALVAALQRRNAPCAAVVGEVTARDGHAIRLR
jgi:selenide,water dikinase